MAYGRVSSPSISHICAHLEPCCHWVNITSEKHVIGLTDIDTHDGGWRGDKHE